jgi:hypothetical protein
MRVLYMVEAHKQKSRHYSIAIYCKSAQGSYTIVGGVETYDSTMNHLTCHYFQYPAYRHITSNHNLDNEVVLGPIQ